MPTEFTFVVTPTEGSTGLTQALSSLTLDDPPSQPQSTSSQGLSQVPGKTEAFSKLETLMKHKRKILKRVPKGAIAQLTQLYIRRLDDVIKDPENVDNWILLLAIPTFCLEAKDKKTKKLPQLVPTVKKNVADYDINCVLNYVPPKPMPIKRSRKKKETAREVADIIESKVEDFDIRGSLRLCVNKTGLAADTPEVVQQLKDVHPPGAEVLSRETDAAQLTVSEKKVLDAIHSFPAGSAGGPDGLRPQVLKDLVRNSNGVHAKTFLTKLTGFVNLVLAGKVPECLRPIFFGANLFALEKKDGSVRPIAVGNSCRRLCSKVIGRAMQSERALEFGTKQLVTPLHEARKPPFMPPAVS